MAESRSLAQRLVMAGQVRVDGQVVLKPSTRFTLGAVITVELGPRFVSRGGEKLEPALLAFGLEDLSGLVCADVGASTGGFTDCMLQHGAAEGGVDMATVPFGSEPARGEQAAERDPD